MGIFVNYRNNAFKDLKNISTQIVIADAHPLWITSLIVCNKGSAPIRFNLQKFNMSGVILQTPCEAASTTNLNATYFNGTAGSGATLTNAGTNIAFSLDGVSLSLNDRVLIKDQTDATQNGIYTLTTVGDGSTPWRLTRAVDYDIPPLIVNGSVVFVVEWVDNANTYWNQTSNVIAVGTTPIVFVAEADSSIFIINELEIKPYNTINAIDITGVIQLEYNTNPFTQNWLSCFSNGYTQVFDCDVNFSELNDLPM